MANLDVYKKLVEEIKKSLLLDDADKQYWLENGKNLPDVIIEGVYNAVKAKNDLMQIYIKTALKNDPDQNYLKQLKTKIKEIKSETLKLSEKEQTADADEILAAQLAKL